MNVFQACQFLLHKCPSITDALDLVAALRMNSVPDTLFGAFHQITPVAAVHIASTPNTLLSNQQHHHQQCQDRNELAALFRMVDVADAFSRADSYRLRFDYEFAESTTVQQMYHDSVTMWSYLLLNEQQLSGSGAYEFEDGIGLLRERTFCADYAATNGRDCTRKQTDCTCRWMQRSIGLQGAASCSKRGRYAHRQAMQARVAERNRYDEQMQQAWQTSSDRTLWQTSSDSNDTITTRASLPPLPPLSSTLSRSTKRREHEEREDESLPRPKRIKIKDERNDRLVRTKRLNQQQK